MKRRYRFLLAFSIILSIAAYVILIHVLPYAIIQPPRINSVNYLDEEKFNYEKVNVVSFDSVILKGYYVPSKLNNSKASIILVHGIGGCKDHFTSLAIKLSKQGYDCWLFDNRAHGESGGLYTTYGYHEKRDIKEIVDRIKGNNVNTKIGVWGNSLGAAISLQALEYDTRINFGIIESSFANMKQIVYDYQKRMFFGIPLKFACNIALNEAGDIARFKPNKVSPLQSAKQIKQPILICHGDEDKNIDVAYGKAIFDNLKSTDKKLIIVKGGEHFGLFSKGGNAYETKILTFLDVQSTN